MCDFCTRCDDACCFCLCATCFPCVAFGRNLERVRLVDSWVWPALGQFCCFAAGGSVAGGNYALGSAVAGILQCIPLAQRVALRSTLARRLGYHEDLVYTICCECFCSPCSQTQIMEDARAKRYAFGPPRGQHHDHDGAKGGCCWGLQHCCGVVGRHDSIYSTDQEPLLYTHAPNGRNSMVVVNNTNQGGGDFGTAFAAGALGGLAAGIAVDEMAGGDGYYDDGEGNYPGDAMQ